MILVLSDSRTIFPSITRTTTTTTVWLECAPTYSNVLGVPDARRRVIYGGHLTSIPAPYGAFPRGMQAAAPIIIISDGALERSQKSKQCPHVTSDRSAHELFVLLSRCVVHRVAQLRRWFFVVYSLTPLDFVPWVTYSTVPCIAGGAKLGGASALPRTKPRLANGTQGYERCLVSSFPITPPPSSLHEAY